ncbi:MAG: ATP-dependent zinc metalloprotease FtsH [bacterium]|nr:ATP-dependent zinc metalloprotease FtsH [bacterium]
MKTNSKQPIIKRPQVRIRFIKFNPQKLIAWVLIIFLLAVSFIGQAKKTDKEKISLSQALEEIKQSKVKKVEVIGNTLILETKEGKKLETYKEERDTVVDLLASVGIDPGKVNVEIKNLSTAQFIQEALLSFILPTLALFLLFFWMMKQARGAQQSIFSFGKSKAKLFYKGKQDVTFKDVAGVEEAKKELEEVVDFLKNPKKYQKMGARTPKGVLLVGPPGVGKTLLAKAVAGEAGVPFFSMAGSEFMEMLVGVGAARVRDLFRTAKKQAPSIIFIDEIDAIGRQRGLGMTAGHDEREQTLNQILVELDGFTPNDNVVVIAATNRADLLDSALLRPGRFDRRVFLEMPDIADRLAILGIHKRGKPFDENINWHRVAQRTVGFSGADLENMLNEAAILAAQKNRAQITMADIESAMLKVKLGPERKITQTKEDRLMTAYHEGGHALVAKFTPKAYPVHRVSIVSRGMALGFTEITPEKDKYSYTKSELLAQIRTMMGGRAAEELIYDEMTQGAASDIERATQIARQMVVDFGMSDLGPIKLSAQYQPVGPGRSLWEKTTISDETQQKVDEQVKKIIEAEYKKARQILKEKRPILDELAKELVEKETVEGDRLNMIIEKFEGKKQEA